MLGRFRSAIYGALGTPEGEPGSTGSGSGSSPSVPDLRSRIDSVSNGISSGKKVKYAYHIACTDCAIKEGICAKCAKQNEIVEL